MSKIQEVVLFDDPTIVEFKTVQGWVGKDGRFYGKDERQARFANSTHSACECGGIARKPYTYCPTCITKKDNERYLNMPFKEWDFETPLVLFKDDKYFFGIDDIEDYCEDEEIAFKDLQLVICEPNSFSCIPTDYWEDVLPEDGELPDSLIEKIKAFNAFVATLPPASWSGGKYRTEYKPT